MSTTSLGQPRGVIVIGASAGGVDALKQLASGLPSELPYSVLVVLHMAAGTPSVLARIIDRSGPLPAQQAVDGEHLRPGRIYVAVPDRHLLVDDHRAVVSRGPTPKDGFRPAINPLLRSAAMAYGPCAVGATSYRCRVGHAWTPEALFLARDRETESALWVALRSLEEKAAG